MKNYLTEREGQLDFFDKYSITFENNYGEEILKDSTDGIFRGSLFEFKLTINDLNKVLFQAIKYLSKERIKGHNVPASIFLVDLNKNIVFEYKSKNYFKDIHKIYNGAASKEISGFVGGNPSFIFYLDKIEDKKNFIDHLDTNTDFLKIDIDENCIVGWAERFYRENPKATKDDFLKDDGELRKPDKFKDFINPYTGETNEKFKYLMDKLNEKQKKKTLGAFYTPIEYCNKVKELVDLAISKVPEGYDYIILDRCAGTGNLESVLSDEQLSHCILSSYEYYEWLVLKERLENKVLKILPENPTFNNGFISENDALSKSFVENEFIKKYINDKKCIIILLENPPYAEAEANIGGQNSSLSKSYVYDLMKKNNIKGTFINELANRFIWSGFNLYLRDDNDSYILLSPIKYWKNGNIINKKFNSGFIFNRKHFHATPSAITAIYWENKNENINELKNLKIYDIEDSKLIEKKVINIKRCFKSFAELFYDSRKFNNDDYKSFIICGKDGKEISKEKNVKITVKPIYNKNIIGYLASQSMVPAFNNFLLNRANQYNAHGFHLRSDNYLNKTAIIAASLLYVNSDDWFVDIYYKTSDGGTKYESDNEFLKSCLIYTCLSQHNKCLSFKGSDNRDYFNELCFDRLSSHKSQALIDLDSMTLDPLNNQSRPLHPDSTDSIITKDENGNKILKFAPLTLNKDEKELLDLWEKIMNDASKTKNYNPNYSYGLYQIIQELNTFTKEKDGNQYDYPLLNGNINTLKTKLKEYYKKYIEPKCFEYELLK